MAVHYLGDNGPDGTSLGVSTSELISFYGVTPVAQRSGASQAAVSTSAYVLISATSVNASASNGAATWGFASSTQANQVVSSILELQNRSSAGIALANELRAALVALGAIAGA